MTQGHHRITVKHNPVLKISQEAPEHTGSWNNQRLPPWKHCDCSLNLGEEGALRNLFKDILSPLFFFSPFPKSYESTLSLQKEIFQL